MRFLLLAAVLSAPIAVAQSVPSWAEPVAPPSTAASPPDPGGDPGTPDDPPQVPIDGGLGLLALAGGAYAARKLWQRQ